MDEAQVLRLQRLLVEFGAEVQVLDDGDFGQQDLKKLYVEGFFDPDVPCSIRMSKDHPIIFVETELSLDRMRVGNLENQLHEFIDTCYDTGVLFRVQASQEPWKCCLAFPLPLMSISYEALSLARLAIVACRADLLFILAS